MSKKPMPRTKAAAEAAKVERKTYGTKLAHPSFAIEPCPNCEFPEADGGFCPECGWTRFVPSCPHCSRQ